MNVNKNNFVKYHRLDLQEVFDYLLKAGDSYRILTVYRSENRISSPGFIPCDAVFCFYPCSYVYQYFSRNIKFKIFKKTSGQAVI